MHARLGIPPANQWRPCRWNEFYLTTTLEPYDLGVEPNATRKAAQSWKAIQVSSEDLLVPDNTKFTENGVKMLGGVADTMVAMMPAAGPVGVG